LDGGGGSGAVQSRDPFSQEAGVTAAGFHGHGRPTRFTLPPTGAWTAGKSRVSDGMRAGNGVASLPWLRGTATGGKERASGLGFREECLLRRRKA